MNEETIKEISRDLNESADTLKKRLEAYSLYKKLPLPNPKENSWRYTNLDKVDFGGKVVNTSIGFSLPEEFKKKNVFVMGLGHVSEEVTEEMKILKEWESRDKILAMHNALWHNGIIIYVPRDVVLETPFSVTHDCREHGLSLAKTIIILDKGSSMKYIERLTGSCIGMVNNTVDIYLKEGAKLDFHTFQDWNLESVGFNTLRADLGRGCRINWFIAQLGGNISRIKADSYLKGKGSESYCYGVSFSDKRQHMDLTTDAYHLTPNTSGDIKIKSILKDNSSTVYRGMIKIEKAAQQTNSYLSDHALLLEGNAVANSIPSLMIDADDVKASHGATIGKPDEEEIFYLMSRGLSRKKAQEVLIEGYLAETLDKFTVPELKEEVFNIVKAKIGV